MKESFAALKVKANEAKAFNEQDCVYCTKDELINQMRCLYSDYSYLQRQINDLYDALYQHTNDGHLPKIVGAGRLKQALEVLGLGDDYKVEPRTIYASTGEAEKLVLEISKK